MRVRLVAASILAFTLTTSGCASDDGGSASTESSDAARSVDPTTLEGSCSLLVGPEAHFVDDAFKLGSKIVKGEKVDVSKVQNNLFKLITEGAPEIQDAAGQLVDYLDDPVAYQPEEESIFPAEEQNPATRAANTIEKLCAKY